MSFDATWYYTFIKYPVSSFLKIARTFCFIEMQGLMPQQVTSHHNNYIIYIAGFNKICKIKNTTCQSN